MDCKDGGVPTSPTRGTDRGASSDDDSRGPWLMPCWKGLFAELLRDAVGQDRLVEDRLVEEVLHDEGVLARVLVVLAGDLDGAEALDAVEELRGQVGLADIQGDPGPAMARELAHELGDHLPAHPAAAELGVRGEVED